MSKTAVGSTFFTGSVGFVLASLLAGPMVHRLGMRVALIVGATMTAVAGFDLAQAVVIARY